MYTSAYRPQAYGGTKGVHRFINDSVSMYVTKFAREWDLWIHASAFVHNKSVITGTDGLTPFLLIYGREPVMPTDVMLLYCCCYIYDNRLLLYYPKTSKPMPKI